MQQQLEEELKSFLIGQEIEMRWLGDILSVWIPLHNVLEFGKIVKHVVIENCVITDTDLFFDLTYLCKQLNINPENFKKNDL